MGRRRVLQKSEVLRASEIAQYSYCSYAWFLQRCGYQAESPFLEIGKQAHKNLGDTMDGCEVKMRYARWCGLLGFVAFCVAMLAFLFGVIL